MSRRTKRNLGAVATGTLITMGMALIGWLGLQVYNGLDARISNTEALTASLQNTVITDHEDIQWIKGALQNQGFSPSGTIDEIIK